MSVLTILLVLVVVGVILWLINAYVPMPANFKRFVNVVIIIILIIWLLRVFGLWGAMSDVKV